MNSEQQLRDHYQDVRCRLTGQKRGPNVVKISIPRPLPEKKETISDSGVETYESLRARIHRLSIRQIIVECAKRHGMTYEMIIGHQRSAPFIAARQEAVWLAYQKGTLSKSALCRHFNRKDHTSIIHLLRRYEAMYGLQNGDKTSIEFVRMRANAQPASA